MSITVKEISHLLSLTSWSFQNARDLQEIQDKIQIHGYDTAHMDSLIELRTRMESEYYEQQRIRADQDTALKNFAENYSQEKKQYQHLRLMVKKVILENEYEKYRRLLGIDEALKKNFEGFLGQARKLYTGCRDDKVLLERLTAKFKKTVETYRERVNALDVLNGLHNIHETAKGLSQVATKSRDNLFKKFRKEWKDFKDICKIAYEDEENPQYQELVGIKAYSPGYQKNPTDEIEPPVPPTPPVPPVPTIPPTPPALTSTMETTATMVTPVTQELPIKN